MKQYWNSEFYLMISPIWSCYTILVWRILDPIPIDVPTNIKGKHVSLRKLYFCWVLLYFMQVNTVKHHLAAVSVCLPDKQHYYYSTSPRVLADRHLHCSLFKAEGVCDCCCHQAEDMLLCNVKCCLCSFTAGNQCASCPFTHSFSPICQPVFFFNRSLSIHLHYVTINLLPILSHTATCHWKESITLSAHSQEDV